MTWSGYARSVPQHSSHERVLTACPQVQFRKWIDDARSTARVALRSATEASKARVAADKRAEAALAQTKVALVSPAEQLPSTNDQSISSQVLPVCFSLCCQCQATQATVERLSEQLEATKARMFANVGR